MEKRITTPLTEEKVKALKAGDSVLLSGVIYTGRDAAHKRLAELLVKRRRTSYRCKGCCYILCRANSSKGTEWP